MKPLFISNADADNTDIDYVAANKVLEIASKCWTNEQIQICLNCLHGFCTDLKIAERFFGKFPTMNCRTRLYVINYIVQHFLPIFLDQNVEQENKKRNNKNIVVSSVKRMLLKIKSISQKDKTELTHILFKIPISK